MQSSPVIPIPKGVSDIKKLINKTVTIDMQIAIDESMHTVDEIMQVAGITEAQYYAATRA